MPDKGAKQNQIQVETFVSNLEVPWSLAFGPDGKLFIAERPGRVRVALNGKLQLEPIFQLKDVFAEGETGLMVWLCILLSKKIS